MPIIDSTQILGTPFEPVQSNRFVLKVDGIPAYLVKGVSAISLDQTAVELNHINVQRFVKGKTKWNTIDLTLFSAISPSGAQSVMEWIRLGHESVTGRNGYSDFYKKNLTLQILGPVGDVASEWVLYGCFPTNVNFGDFSYDDDGTAVNIKMTIRPDYCVLNY
jgi:hypothetical protein